MRSIAGILISFLILGGGSIVTAQKVVVKMKNHAGAIATYKHSFRTRFKSDRSDLLASANTSVGGQEGNIRNDDVRLEITGEWRTEESWVPREKGSEGSGEWKIVAKILESDSRATLNGEKIGYEKFPFTLEQLKNREFSFELSPAKGPSLMKPEFRPWQLHDRTDIVTDLFLVWASGISPSFPDYAIAEGDTWESEQTLKFPFYALEATAKEAAISVKSQYTVKKVKKGGKIFEIAEDREVQYLGWTETSSFSVIIAGDGKGSATWEIDTEKGIVNKCRYQQFIGRPDISIYGENKVLEQVRAEYEMGYEMKLDKFKK